MLKLKRYLKPFTGVLLLAVALLFGQALCDLSLPNYMSDIVNVGLQQDGIEDYAPAAISQEGMTLMRSLMSAEEQDAVEKSYALKSGAEKNSEGKSLAELYPAAKDGSLYVRQETGNNETLNAAFGNAAWALIQLLRTVERPTEESVAAGVEDTATGETNAGADGAVTDGTGDETEESGAMDIGDVDINQLYELSQLPPEKLAVAREMALRTDETFRRQGAVAFIRMFYGELGVDMEATQRAYVLRMGLWMLIIAVLGGIATILVSLISSRVAAGVARDLRKDLFDKVESFSNTELDRFSTASLITRSTNDTNQIQMVLQFGIRMLCYAPFLGLGGALMAMQKSPSMSWMLGIACVILLGLMLVVFSLAMPRFKILQKLTDRLNLVSRETLTGLMVIRAFGTQKHEEERFDETNREMQRVHLFVNRVMVFMMPVMMLIMNGLSLLVMWVGAHQVSQATMQVGDIMAYIQYAMFVIMGFLMIAMMFIFIPRASVSAERIHEVLSTEPSIHDPEQPRDFQAAKKGILEFRHVNFRYQGADEDVLHDISFTTRRGETTAIIGPTGSGKSTVVNLIMRFYDVTGGQILVDGTDIRAVSQKDLRDRIGYVPQRGVLLSGSIAYNLKYGKPDADDGAMHRAAAIAQASEFIESRETQYEDEIAQGGTNVSGGQRQRLSIARALVKAPEYLIFDDSFSALDFKTDAALRKALRKHTHKDTTTIIVTQRVSTIMQAEQILVLSENGELVGQGTHQKLLQNCPAYYEIASSQLAKEELA